MLVGKREKCSDHHKPRDHRHHLRPRQKGQRVADQAYQRKSAHSAENILLAQGFSRAALFTVESDEEGEEEHNNNLDPFWAARTS